MQRQLDAQCAAKFAGRRVEPEVHRLELIAARGGALHGLDLQIAGVEHEFPGPRIDASQIEGGMATQHLGRKVHVQIEVETGGDELERVGLAVDVGPVGRIGCHRHARRRPSGTSRRRRRRDIGGPAGGRTREQRHAQRSAQ